MPAVCRALPGTGTQSLASRCVRAAWEMIRNIENYNTHQSRKDRTHRVETRCSRERGSFIQQDVYEK